MTKRASQRAAADAPSTYVDPEFKRRRRAEEQAEEQAENERYEALCGPVVVRQAPQRDKDQRT